MKLKLFTVFAIFSLLIVSCTKKPDQKVVLKTLSNEVDSIIQSSAILSPNQIEKTKTLVEAYKTYVNENPNDSLAPLFLFDAGNKSAVIPDFEAALVLFDKLVADYPKSNYAPKAIMSSGNICENLLGDYGRAKEYYKKLKVNYPEDPLAQQIDLIIKYVGNDDALYEEVMQNKAKKDSLAAEELKTIK